MTVKASVIINIYDHPEYCYRPDPREACNYFIEGHCALRVVEPELKSGLNKFLKLKKSGVFYLKDPSCKFIWEKSKTGKI